MTWLTFLIGVALGGPVPRSSLPAWAIIGDDDRKEWFEVKNPALRELGRSTAVLIEKDPGYLESTGAGYQLARSTPTHGEFDELCPGVRYADQLAPGSCSSFLVAPDVVATAAHCLPGGCGSVHIVFDFLLTGSGMVPSAVSSSRVFACRTVLASDKEDDWALLRLDRPALGRKPFALRKQGEPAVGTPLTILGFPRGLPLKIAGGATVQNPLMVPDPAKFLEADLDTFAGNSGSAVVNTKTLELEGIGVVGFGEFEDWETHPITGKRCHRLRHFVDSAEATPPWVVRSSAFRSALNRILNHI